jgi:hypothetical protein
MYRDVKNIKMLLQEVLICLTFVIFVVEWIGGGYIHVFKIF